jgi:hypothetical protein
MFNLFKYNFLLLIVFICLLFVYYQQRELFSIFFKESNYKVVLSSYRLGDLVLLTLNDDEKNDLLTDHPDTIGAKYILSKNIDNNNIDIITNIVLEHIEKNMHLLPKDIENSTVIHLRLGDVVCGNEEHEKAKRPYDIDYFKSIIPKDNKVYVLGKCFFTKSRSLEHDKCIHLSNQYLENVVKDLNGEYFDGGHADIDLCCAVKSKYFVQGKGYFSKLILEIRKKLNLENIQSNWSE